MTKKEIESLGWTFVETKLGVARVYDVYKLNNAMLLDGLTTTLIKGDKELFKNKITKKQELKTIMKFYKII